MPEDETRCTILAKISKTAREWYARFCNCSCSMKLHANPLYLWAEKDKLVDGMDVSRIFEENMLEAGEYEPEVKSPEALKFGEERAILALKKHVRSIWGGVSREQVLSERYLHDFLRRAISFLAGKTFEAIKDTQVLPMPPTPPAAVKDPPLAEVEEERWVFSGVRLAGIVDPFSIYIPYHADIENWGIYIRARRVVEDFLAFCEEFEVEEVGVPLVFTIYLNTVMTHAMMHHIVEDIATLLEFGSGSSRYPLLKREEEEGFCEYMAFTRKIASTRFTKLFPAVMRWRAGEYGEIFAKVTSALYFHWRRAEDPVYRPRITPEVSRALGPFSFVVKFSHRIESATVLKVRGDEVNRRVFVTER